SPDLSFLGGNHDLAITRLATGQHLPPAQELQLPQTAAEANAYLEAREGMLVALPSPLPVVGPTHSGCGFAVAAQSGQARPIRSATDSELNSVVLILHHSDVDCSQLPALKFGDEVDGISGPLTYHFERYKVVQQDVASLVVQPGAAELLDPLPAHAADLLRAATFNLNNYLRPAETMGDELDGRPSAEALAAKRYKTAATISTALGCPELLAVQEVETVELLGELAADLANACGFTYSVAHRDSPDARGIDVALMVDPRRATILSTMLRQTCTPLDTGILDAAANCSPGQYPLFSRPPLEVGLRIDGERFRVLVNHFKSKREGEAETAPRRLAQANYVHGLVKSWLEMDPSAAILVVGDFNDYEQSVVWLRLQEEGILVNALQRVPQEHRYSYIFDGESQLLDGVFVSPALVHRIATAEIRHTNSDYPWSLAADVSTFYGASDHDVPLVAFHAAATMPGQTPLPVTGPVAPAAATGSLSVMATPVFEVQERAAPSPDAAVQPAENSPLEQRSGDPGWPARYLPLGLLLLALLVGCAYVLLRRH
ncbi:MAG: endonuclease/exonuclease/phosphatase family protein, partial [Candidatus Promineifilaceae bacterium]